MSTETPVSRTGATDREVEAVRMEDEPGSPEWHAAIKRNRAAGWRCGAGLALGACDNPDHQPLPSNADRLAEIIRNGPEVLDQLDGWAAYLDSQGVAARAATAPDRFTSNDRDRVALRLLAMFPAAYEDGSRSERSDAHQLLTLLAEQPGGGLDADRA